MYINRTGGKQKVEANRKWRRRWYHSGVEAGVKAQLGEEGRSGERVRRVMLFR